jgi:hypothetical protein
MMDIGMHLAMKIHLFVVYSRPVMIAKLKVLILAPTGSLSMLSIKSEGIFVILAALFERRTRTCELVSHNRTDVQRVSRMYSEGMACELHSLYMVRAVCSLDPAEYMLI